MAKCNPARHLLRGLQNFDFAVNNEAAIHQILLRFLVYSLRIYNYCINRHVVAIAHEFFQDNVFSTVVDNCNFHSEMLLASTMTRSIAD